MCRLRGLLLSSFHLCRDRLAFGEVRGSNKALASAFGVQAFPTLLVVCNGDAETREAYSGDMKSEPIRRFLDQFAGGRRCRQVQSCMKHFCVYTPDPAVQSVFLLPAAETCVHAHGAKHGEWGVCEAAFGQHRMFSMVRPCLPHCAGSENHATDGLQPPQSGPFEGAVAGPGHLMPRLH